MVKRRISVTVILALLIQTLAGAMLASVSAASKKPIVKTRKMSLEVGKTKDIVIKNKVKKNTYVFATNNKKVATVAKTGRVRGVKAGKAKVTVREKTGKRKAKKLGVVSVTVQAAKTSKAKPQDKKESPVVPTPAPEEPTPIVNPPMVAAFPANGLSGRLIQENKGTQTTTIYLDLKNNTAASIQMESGVYLKNTSETDSASIGLAATNLAPGQDVHLEMAANYADVNSQLYLSFYCGGFNYTAIVNTAGAVTVQSPTATAADMHGLLAAHYLALLKEVYTQPDAISINRIKVGTQLVSGREIPVCELDVSLKANDGTALRLYCLVRQYGRPSSLFTTLYSESIGYIWATDMGESEDNTIVVTGMLDPAATMATANQIYAMRSYQLFGK